MTRWHSTDCEEPDVILDFGTPYCRGCQHAPDLDTLIAEQLHPSSVLEIPPDEPPEDLRTRWPSTVKYLPYEGTSLDNAVSPADTSLEQPEQEGTSTIYTETLQDSQFRLFYLYDSSDTKAPIRGDLEVYDYDDCPEYEAASYTWGGETNDNTRCVPIYIGQFWDILLQTRNCATMLRYARRTRCVRILWVDAVCINQRNNAEKAVQIPKISIVFRECMRVIAYLGEEAVGDRSGKFAARRPFKALTRDMLEAIFLCRYFTRVWIIQELVCAPRILIPFQGVEYPLDRLTTRDAPWLNRVEGLQWLKDHLKQKPFEYVGLLQGLEKTWSATSTDPRDKLFGILGLIEQKEVNLVQPDYTISARHMFVGLAAHCLLNLRAGRRILLGSSGIHGWGRLPSWVPDWENTDSWPLHSGTCEDWPLFSELIPPPHRGSSVDATGALNTYMVYVCPLRHSFKYIGVDAQRYLYKTCFEDSSPMILTSENSGIDKLVDIDSDALFYMNKSTYFIMRQTVQGKGEYRIVATIRQAWLKPKKEIYYYSKSDCPRDFDLHQMCINLDHVLQERAAYKIIESPPFFTPEWELSDPHLQRFYPDLDQRQKTRGSKRLMNQVFPGAERPEDTLDTLYEAARLEQSQQEEKDRSYLRLPIHIFSQFFEAMDLVNRRYLGETATNRDREFVTFYFPRECIGQVETWYFCTESSIARDLPSLNEEMQYAPEPLVWEWGLDLQSEDDFLKIDESDPGAITQFRDAVSGQDGVYLRSRLADVLSRLQGQRWVIEVMKRMAAVLCTRDHNYYLSLLLGMGEDVWEDRSKIPDLLRQLRQNDLPEREVDILREVCSGRDTHWYYEWRRKTRWWKMVVKQWPIMGHIGEKCNWELRQVRIV